MVTKSANFSASIQNYQIYVLYKNQGFYVDHFLQMSLMNDSLPEKKSRIIYWWLDECHFLWDVNKVSCISSVFEANELELLKSTKTKNYI